MELSKFSTRATPFKFFNETDFPLVLYTLPYTDMTRIIMQFKVLPSKFVELPWNGVYTINKIYISKGSSSYSSYGEGLAQFSINENELETAMDCEPDYEITFSSGDVTMCPVLVKSATMSE